MEGQSDLIMNTSCQKFDHLTGKESNGCMSKKKFFKLSLKILRFYIFIHFFTYNYSSRCLIVISNDSFCF